MKAKLMSNAKWRKLIEGLEHVRPPIVGYQWKFLGSDLGRIEYGFPQASDLRESGLKDGRFQPIKFADIEFLLIPRTVPDINYNYRGELPELDQPIREIESTIKRLGVYPVEITEQGLIVRGYHL